MHLQLINIEYTIDDRMKTEMISLRLSEKEIEIINRLLAEGYASSRSDLVRVAVFEYCEKRAGGRK